VLKVSVIVVVLGAACLGVIFFSAQPTTPEQEAQEEQP
jgi:hypothetical protein